MVQRDKWWSDDVVRGLGYAAVCLLWFIWTLANSHAQVYSWTDSKGVRHFSDSPQGAPAHATPSQLAPILRGSISIPSAARRSCGSHGGVDCARGPDNDGSVVCADGFREATLRFAFECTSARLEVVELVREPETESLVVYIRNQAQISAQRVVVAMRKGIQFESLTGPPIIEGHGMEGYRLKLSSGVRAPTAGDIKITCDNCAS